MAKHTRLFDKGDPLSLATQLPKQEQGKSQLPRTVTGHPPADALTSEQWGERYRAHRNKSTPPLSSIRR